MARSLIFALLPENSFSVTLRIASWNTWKNHGPYCDRLPAMARVLEVLWPYVLLLQESFQAEAEDEQLDTAQFLADALEFHCAFAPARSRVRTFEGEVLMSHSGMRC